MKTVFIRAIEAPIDEKASTIRSAVRGESAARFERDASVFSELPRSPFAYWVSDSVLSAFRRLKPVKSVATATVGMQSSDDFRFLGLWWERGLPGFVPFAKGGHHSPFYADVHLTVNWNANGHEIKAYAETTPGSKHWSRNIRSAEQYFRPGLTWPRRTNGLSFRAMPAGCIFADKGPAAFVEEDDPRALLALCAVLNSAAFGALVAVQLARTELAQSFEVGLIQQTPIPPMSEPDINSLAERALRSWSLKRRLDCRSENSHAFLLPALLQVDGESLADRAGAWGSLTGIAQAELAALINENDDHVFQLYGISAEDQQRIAQGFGLKNDDAGVDSGEDDEEDEGAADVGITPMVASLLSWSLGAAFGRFDVRLATGERVPPPDPGPFDPLPVCPPGMLTGEGVHPVAPPSGYPLTFPTNGVLVDDPGHSSDLIHAARSVFDTVLDDAGSRWNEAAELLHTPDLRTWFARDFFEEHIKRHSKSRRKAPIYWQLSTASKSYSVWVYIHRATSDTLFRVLNDFVDPKLDHEKAKLSALINEAGATPSAAHRRAIDQQESFVGELQAFKTEVARVAPLWRPNLDDGVLLNFAPLWRLVPQSRNWQSECQKAWEKLASGEYDWAHVAMHLWPERVVTKCREDRSLAIAHQLEDVFWEEDESGEWRKRRVDDARVHTLIAERTSSTVKAALRELLSATTPTPTKSGKAKQRSTSSRSGARKSAPAAPSATPVDEVTLSGVKTAIASVPGGASKDDVLAATGLSDADATRAIGALLDRGDIARTGQKRGTRYRANSHGEDG